MYFFLFFYTGRHRLINCSFFSKIAFKTRIGSVILLIVAIIKCYHFSVMEHVLSPWENTLSITLMSILFGTAPNVIVFPFKRNWMFIMMNGWIAFVLHCRVQFHQQYNVINDLEKYLVESGSKYFFGLVSNKSFWNFFIFLKRTAMNSFEVVEEILQDDK